MAVERVGNLQVTLTTRDSGFKRGMKQASQNVQKFERNAERATKRVSKMDQGMAKLTRSVVAMGGAFAAALSVRQLVRFGAESLKAFAAQEEAVEGLRAALEVTGKTGGDALQKLTKSATALQRATQAADEELLAATTTLASLAPSLSADELVQAQKSIIGIADTFTDGNLQNAALSLGKSLSGTVDLLARYGIGIGTAGDASERLGRAIEKTDRLFQVAAAKTDTLKGRTVQLTNAWGDLKEAIGGAGDGAFGFKSAIESVTTTVQLATDAMRTDFEKAFTTFGRIAAFAFVRAYLVTLRAIQESMIKGFTSTDEKLLEKVLGGFAFDLALGRVEAAAKAANVELESMARHARTIADASASLPNGNPFLMTLVPLGGASPVGDQNIEIPTAPKIGGTGRLNVAPADPNRRLYPSATGFDEQVFTGLNVPDLPEPPKIPAPDIPEWIAEWQPTYEKELADFAKDAKQGAFAIGEQLVQGLINGSLSMKDLLKSAMSIVANIVTSGLAGGLGIFSPSRVTFEMGQQIGRGLVLGMDSMAGSVGSAAERMAGSATPSAASSIQSSGAFVAKIQTDDTSSYPPWALDWLARANIELAYSGE